jgi:hypothetical protein
MQSIVRIVGALLFASLLAPSFAHARSSSGGGHRNSRSGNHNGGSHSSTPSITHSSNHPKAIGVSRDAYGRIARSAHAKNEFKKSHPCPSTGKSSGACPGYVVDHIAPLKRGGADSPGNMQWQTREAARIKDKTE